MTEKQEQIIAEIQRIVRLYGTDSLTQNQFEQHSTIGLTTVRYHFGSWNKAIEAAGLEPVVSKPNPATIISEDELLQEIIRLTIELGKQPTHAELNANGRFSIKPYRDRWGKFSDAVNIAYAKYGYPLDEPKQSGIASAITQKPSIQDTNTKIILGTSNQRKKVQYGEPINFRGLRHAPVNEQGVVYLFGIVSRELGFLVESVRTAYPDCEGKRCVDEKRQLWEHVLIEFEFKSSNFREHGHKPEGCDLIICWIHDWTTCPLEVLELRSAINYLPNK